MTRPKITDLHNPNNIVGFTDKNGITYVADDNQGFQEYPKSIELWQEMENGLIMMVCRWHKKSGIFFHTK